MGKEKGLRMRAHQPKAPVIHSILAKCPVVEELLEAGGNRGRSRKRYSQYLRSMAQAPSFFA